MFLNIILKYYVFTDTNISQIATGCVITNEPTNNLKDPTEIFASYYFNELLSLDYTLQHIATHCNTLQHIATHCNTLQHIATYCNTLQHSATYCNTLQHIATHCDTLQHIATYCNTLQHIATHCNTFPATVDNVTSDER